MAKHGRSSKLVSLPSPGQEPQPRRSPSHRGSLHPQCSLQHLDHENAVRKGGQPFRPCCDAWRNEVDEGRSAESVVEE